MIKGLVRFRCNLMCDGLSYTLEKFTDELWSIKNEFDENEKQSVAQASLFTNNISILEYVQKVFGLSAFKNIDDKSMNYAFEKCIILAAFDSIDFIMKEITNNTVPSLKSFFFMMFCCAYEDWTPALYYMFNKGYIGKNHARECLEFSAREPFDPLDLFQHGLRKRFYIFDKPKMAPTTCRVSFVQEASCIRRRLSF